jgi:mono/diheme cytochrome c family protein
MKKVLTLSAFIVIVAAACHKKAVPATTQTMPDSSAPAVAAADPATVEAGHAIYTTKCTKCHALKVVDNYTADRWVGILKSMIPKAKLDDTEAAQVTAYVNANAKK